ncbi:MAG: lysylphosphatidylglycerol synthase transmembrane domain-containing protein [Bacillota bacterium]
MKNVKLQKIAYIFFLLFTFGVIAVIGLLDHNKVRLDEAVAKMDIMYVCIAVFCLIMFWFLEAYTLKYVTVSMDKKISFFSSLRIGLIGLLYGALTPSATGGQPVQIMFMRKNGIPTGTATSVMVVKFIAFQTSICILFVMAVLYKFVFFLTTFSEELIIIAIGFTVNVGVLIVAVLSMTRRRWIENTALRLLNWLHRVRIVKNLDKAKASLENTLEEFHSGMVAIRQIKSRIWYLISVVCVQMLFQFAITYFIYRACGLSMYTALDIVSLQAILYLTVAYIPLPGASIASEGGFILVFGGVFGPWAFTGMVLWRALTYYAQIIFGGITMLVENLLNRRSKIKQVS